MFDVPFLYGGGWNATADRGADPVIVLSKRENEIQFGGINSVGRTVRWNDFEFRVVGVLADWSPRPKFYDLNNGAFNMPEDAYIPLGWTEILQRPPKDGNHSCWRVEMGHSFQDYLNADCVWLQAWVELPGARSRERMQTFIDGYWEQQRKAGRFQRPRNNRLTNVGQWLTDQRVVGTDSRLLVGMSFAFLIVCLINTVGLLLAKFLKGAPLAGIRRALGASRRQVFAQHLVETGVLAGAGSLLGLGLAALGLWGLHTLYSVLGDFGAGRGAQLARFDTASVVIAVVLAVFAALLAGLYPAWRVGRLPPAIYLKSQ
jgi:putative ABC transport system permease protein